MDFYVSVYSHEFATAFLQATAPLCPDIQRRIWKEVLHNPYPIDPPPAPRKWPVYSRISTTQLLCPPRKLFEDENH
jgi:hypothetical protein